MENPSHHNTALYYIWENNCSFPSACFFDLQKGDICVLGKNDGFKVVYLDKEVNGNSKWGDFHVIDTLTEYNLNLPKEHEILCQTGPGKVVSNELVLKRLISVCKNEWVKDFFLETKSVISGIEEFWNVRQLIRLTGDYELTYLPQAQKTEEESIVDESASSMYYIPEVESLGSELIARNINVGDYCICKKGNGALFLRIDHAPFETDIYSSFGLVEEVEDTDIMFPLVYLQLCKKGVKKEKCVKFLNRFKNAFVKKESKNIIDICIRIANGENASLPSFNFIRDWDVEPDVTPEEYFGQQVVDNKKISHTISEQKSVYLFEELSENIRLDIEIQYLKSIRKQNSTRSLFRQQYPNVKAFYQFALDSKSQKDNLPEVLDEVYLELLKSVRSVLNASDYSQSVKLVFQNAVADFNSSKRKSTVVETKKIDLSLSNNRKGTRWTKEEEEMVVNLYKDGIAPKDIALSMGRTENSICMRLDKLGLITYSYETGIIENIQIVHDEQTNLPDYSGLYVENSFSIGTLYDKSGNLLFSDTGKLKILNGTVYRFNRKGICFTVKKVEHTNNNKWYKSDKLLVAYDASDLYEVVKGNDFIDKIESFNENEITSRNTIKVDGELFDYFCNYINNVEESVTKNGRNIDIKDKGWDDIEIEHVYLDKYGKVISKSELKYNHEKVDCLSTDDDANKDSQLDEHVCPSENGTKSETEESRAYNAALKDIQEEVESQSRDLYSNAMVYIPTDAQFESKDKQFVPKGQLKNIATYVKDYKDVLWLVSLIDIVEKERLSESFTLEQIASMEIANMWEILRQNSSFDADGIFTRCIDFLSTELNLSKNASSKEVYKAIKDFPISGEYEELVDILSESSHFNLLKAWIYEEEEDMLEEKSKVFYNSCLYSISSSRYETTIRTNPSWRYYLINNRKELKHYFFSLKL